MQWREYYPVFGQVAMDQRPRLVQPHLPRIELRMYQVLKRYISLMEYAYENQNDPQFQENFQLTFDMMIPDWYRSILFRLRHGPLEPLAHVYYVEKNNQPFPLEELKKNLANKIFGYLARCEGKFLYMNPPKSKFWVEI